MKTDRGEPVAGAMLPILHGDAFAHDRLAAIELTAGDIDHAALEPGVREIRIDRERAIEGAKPRLAPRGVAEPILVPPVVGLEADGVLGRRAPFADLRRADQQE